VMASVDKLSRSKWTENSFVDVWSARNSKWYVGMVVKIFTDEMGEWLRIKYNNNTCEKEVQRYSTTIRCCEKVSPKHKALDWSTNAVAWWASKQAAPMRKYSTLLHKESINGRSLLNMSALGLELLGIALDDIESCLKLILDLQKDPKMIKKINWNTSPFLDRLTETTQDSEEFLCKNSKQVETRVRIVRV